jgi:hypothetical protein
VSTFTSRDVEAADELALARLDDDGAAGGDPGHRTARAKAITRSAGVTPDSLGSHQEVAGRQTETAAAASGEEAELAPALLGAGYLPSSAAPGLSATRPVNPGCGRQTRQGSPDGTAIGQKLQRQRR